ncbi:MAG: FHA domain-containing protein [Akkermansiaceae bacterium]|jgi:predicted component of type VI protein secretion system
MPRINITEPGKDSQAYSFDLKRMQLKVGRSSDNDITISHRSVSKVHCLIERRKGGYMIFNNGSTNGIKYEGERHADLALTNGMELEIGDVPAVFTLTDEECDHLTEERLKERENSEKEEEQSEDEENSDEKE